MEFKDLLDLGQAGAVVILLYINRDLWKRMNDLQDRVMSYLEDHHINAMIIQSQTEELRRLQANIPGAEGNSQKEID